MAQSPVVSGTMASGKLNGKPIPRPLLHWKHQLVTQQLEKDIKEIQLCAAQALGFHTAIIQKMSAMQNNISVLDDIRREMCGLHIDLKGLRAQLGLNDSNEGYTQNLDTVLGQVSSIIVKNVFVLFN